MSEAFEKIQNDFHKVADGKRFLNRLNNPFINTKEKNLAIKISRKIPPGGKHVLEIGCGEGNNLFYLSGGLKYNSKIFSIETVIPIVSQNGGIYTQVGKLFVRNSGLYHPDTTAGEGHIPGSVIDGETITNLNTGFGDFSSESGGSRRSL